MKNKYPSKKRLREFGLLLGFLIPFFIGWFLPFIFGHEIRLWTIYLGITLIIFGIFLPNKLKYLYLKWIMFGNLLAFVNSHIILGIIFLLIMQPIAIIMKIFRYDPLKLKKDSLKTYREIKKNDKIDLEKIF